MPARHASTGEKYKDPEKMARPKTLTREKEPQGEN